VKLVEQAVTLRMARLPLMAIALGVPVLAQHIIVPVTPPAITPPAGNVAFLEGHGVGTQGYVCLPTSTTNSWTVNSSRPQATLSITAGKFTQQILTHFLSPNPSAAGSAPPSCILSVDSGEIDCPTWESSFDSSEVWGSKAGSINAGTDPSCPDTGAIPCLLLQAIGTQTGPNGFGFMTQTTYIQRLNTTGGSAPTVSCNVGDQALVPYTADYYFWKAEN
jgi:hypothetical protein